MTKKRGTIFLIVALAFLIGIAVGVGGSIAWVKVERYLERTTIMGQEASDLVYRLTGYIHDYRARTQRLPESARQAIELLPEDIRDDLARTAFYRNGKLIWSVQDGVPQPLGDGRGLVCWFWNPERKHLAAAIVMTEDGSLEMETLPLKAILQTL